MTKAKMPAISLLSILMILMLGICIDVPAHADVLGVCGDPAYLAKHPLAKKVCDAAKGVNEAWHKTLGATKQKAVDLKNKVDAVADDDERTLGKINACLDKALGDSKQ